MATDDLAELLHLAKLGNKMRWIPVTPDTMPTPGQDVMAYIDGGAIAVARYYPALGEWVVGNICGIDVRFWMPTDVLPEPPKDGK